MSGGDGDDAGEAMEMTGCGSPCQRSGVWKFRWPLRLQSFTKTQRPQRCGKGDNSPVWYAVREAPSLCKSLGGLVCWHPLARASRNGVASALPSLAGQAPGTFVGIRRGRCSGGGVIVATGGEGPVIPCPSLTIFDIHEPLSVSPLSEMTRISKTPKKPRDP